MSTLIFDNPLPYGEGYLMFLEERLVISFVLKFRLLRSSTTAGLQDSTRHDQWCQSECLPTYYSPDTPTGYIVAR